MKEQIATQLIRYLEQRGITHLFGLCGHTNIAVLAALSKSSKIKFINTRHEQIAAHAADGYARASKKAAVLLSHLSPGLTNAATGVANASLDSIPLEPHFRAARQSGAIEVTEYDEGMLQLGLRAAASRLPFLPTRAGLGSDVMTVSQAA